MKPRKTNLIMTAVTGVAAILAISAAGTADDADTALLHQAQQLFKPLPKDIATPTSPLHWSGWR
jgi:hypothetical protein